MKIGVVGLGLIGGSIFKCLKEKYEIIGVSSSVIEPNVSKDYNTLKSCDLVFVGVEHGEASVDLVITRPKNDRGVVSEFSDDRGCLLLYLSFKGLVFGILSARHCEILPYHYTVSIAIIVERVILVDVSAPHSEYVTANVRNKSESLFISLGIA